MPQLPAATERKLTADDDMHLRMHLTQLSCFCACMCAQNLQ